MDNTSPIKKTQGPDWNGVRPIYKKLSEEFHVLTSAYKLDIDENRKNELDHLIVVIDELDFFVDNLPLKNQRDEITDFLVHYLENEDSLWQPSISNDKLGTKMENLRDIVHREGIVQEFVGAARTIFHNTEVKRHTHDPDELIGFILLEGAATALLPLSILKVEPTHGFAIFFTQLCTLMGIADLVVDARDDYKENCIALKPNWNLYFKLNKIMFAEGLKMLWNFPKKLSFILYCMKFTWVLFTEK